MKLLITGATGFVGRNVLLDALKNERYEEILLPVRSLEKLRAQFIGDGIDEIPARVTPLLTSAPEWVFDRPIKADHVIHAAGVVFASTREDYFRTNCLGTLNFLRKIERPSRVVILSSIAAAGPCTADKAQRDENDSDDPLTFYGESKLAMERRLLADFPELNYLCLRPPMVLGPRDTATLPLFKMVRNPLHFKPGFRAKYFSYIAVSDLSRAIFSALNSTEDWTRWPSRHLYVSAREQITDKQLLSSAAEVSGKWGVVCRVPQPLLKVLSHVVDAVPAWRKSVPTLTRDRAKEIWPDRWLISPEKFSKIFEWEAVEDLRSVLAATHDWYVSTGQLST